MALHVAGRRNGVAPHSTPSPPTWPHGPLGAQGEDSERWNSSTDPLQESGSAETAATGAAARSNEMRVSARVVP